MDAIATQLLLHPLSQLYVKTYFPESTREVTGMVKHIRAGLNCGFVPTPGWTNPCRKAALEKLSRVDIQVRLSKILDRFSSIDIRADDHLGSNQRIAAFNLKREARQIATAGQG
ncbi:MAG: hypothetical protein IPP01_06605 [Saprospiraceae bacterium]|nr:hypothetical protein [Saprospiraceae bacterium]